MKLRLRLDKCSQVIEISDEISENLTVADLSERALNSFQDYLFGEYYLSLNKKDPLDGHLKVVGDCDIVSGDLVYIVRTGDSAETTPSSQQHVVSSAASGSSLTSEKNAPSCTSGQTNKENKSHDQVENHAKAAMNMDTGQPGTSSQNDPAPETGTSYDVTMETEEETVDIAVVKQCLSEPVLCREAANGTVPALLREMYEALGPKNIAESLSTVLHVLMLETGFTVHPESENTAVSQLPGEWRYGGYYKFSYTYQGCADTTCCITIVPTGNSVAVHGKVLSTSNATRQCSFKTEEYVQAVNKDCAACYCQLAKLSMLFKDSIANPLVHDIRTAAGLVDVFGLLALTQEIKLRILSFLDVRSLLQVSCVNTELLEISKDPYLWRCLYLRNFDRHDNSLSQNWKELYKKEYKSRKERRKMMSRMKIITPPYWGPQNPFSGPSNWIPPVPGGIIGGDYDLYPNFPSSLPGVPGRMGPRPPSLPRPRYDLIGPGPDVDPGPDPGLIPRRPGGSGRGGGRGSSPFGGFGGFGPRFF
ncbi:F-box only protein 7-like isoform X2 [Mercenaria mercenaria]|uniref:F-box only protein 7-like isoform X2 n=1 Tax=Mercenaria mercenaria TaxID=6596 RepID=UPI00234F066B|nr:F-box only protein 7-like isoform X2 [Mercenaria mercenaria]